MNETQPKRRWFRFSLRTLFFVVMGVCAALAWVSLNIRQVRERDSMLQRINSQEDNVEGLITLHTVDEEKPKLPLLWRIFGAQPLVITDIRLSRENWTAEEIAKIESLFPEADIFVSDHHDFSEHTRPALIPYGK
jgi:hypothetical protein